MIQPPSIGRRVLSAGLGVTLSLLELPVTPFLAWGDPKPARALLRLEAITDTPEFRGIQGTGCLIAQANYTYDAVGNRTSLTDPVGLHSYTYDALNRLSGATHPLLSPPHPLGRAAAR
ncbi:MAG: RHS repeat protein [Candidatus Omnitrophica bacterium]|nr:RHS repeat protein [Candidatus Omnitrophota bacterium]